MSRIASFDIFAVDLPFRKPFKHAAAARASSYSIFLKCTAESGTTGFGESLPREYVTGESREGAFRMLGDDILPRLVGQEFHTMSEVEGFLRDCDGKTPAWVPPDTPQTAAWCAVDLSLLDTFGREFGVPALAGAENALPEDFRYSGALSSDKGWGLIKSALKQRLFGIRKIKLKVDSPSDDQTLRTLRRVLGSGVDIRVDANMAWNIEQALDAMARMSNYGVRSYEQPLPANELDGLSRLVAETKLGVMADESLSDRDSLQRLIKAKACTAVNVRVSKCGGLVASLARATQALEASLVVQLGCQVGESSLLSAAQLILARHVRHVTYAEGCFGKFLLRDDPVSPVLQFGYGGRPPSPPTGPGLGVRVDEQSLHGAVVERAHIH